MDEREAIERMRHGDIRGLEVLVRAHQLRAVRAAFLVVRDVALAQDIVQAAFLRAYERIDQLDPARPFAPWFLASVLHDAAKAVCRRDRDASFEQLSPVAADPADGRPQPEAVWEQAETADEIWAALGGLPPQQRTAIVARYYLGMLADRGRPGLTAMVACTSHVGRFPRPGVLGRRRSGHPESPS